MSTQSNVARPVVIRPTFAVARAEAARCARIGRPVPAFYQQVLDDAAAADRRAEAERWAREKARRARNGGAFGRG